MPQTPETPPDSAARSTVGKEILGALLLFLFIFAWRAQRPDRGPSVDVVCYLTAFERVGAGISPYSESQGVVPFLYPPTFAWAGHVILESFGTEVTRWMLRTGNQLAVAIVVWLSLCTVEIRWGARLLAGLGIGLFDHVVVQGLDFNNVSPLVAAMAILPIAALQWTRIPLAVRVAGSGIVLGLGILIKPMAAIIPALWFFVPPRPDGSRRPGHRPAAMIAGAVAGGGLLLSPYLREFLAVASRSVAHHGLHFSFYRFLHCLGLGLSTGAVAALVAGAAAWLGLTARRRGWDDGLVLAWLSTSALVATPVVWGHSLILTLPVQVGAVAVFWRYRRATAGPAEPVLLALGLLSLRFSDSGLRGLVHLDPAFSCLAIVVPALTPIALLAYLVAFTPSAAAAPPCPPGPRTRPR